MKREQIIDKIKVLASKLTLEGGKVYLFGSQARGDYRADSDWDVLVLLNKDRIDNRDFDNIAYPMIEMGWEYGADISPKMYTFKDWSKRSFTPFYKNVTTDSIQL